MSNTNSNQNIDNIKQKSLEQMTPEEQEALAIEAVTKAIKRMHSKGIPTVEVAANGTRHLRHPDGTLTPIIIV
jgi:methylthioribose-1-phosphate isomerase